MSTGAVKLEKDLCRCCHIEGDFKSLYTPYKWLAKEKVVYSEMLRECFNLELVQASDPIYEIVCGICNVCIMKLHDALMFKRQVEKCEKQFREVYFEHLHNAGVKIEIEVKEETIDLTDAIQEKVNVSDLNVVINEDVDNKLCNDGKTADDDDDEWEWPDDDCGMADNDVLNSDQASDKDCKLNDEEDRAAPRRKRKPRKKNNKSDPDTVVPKDEKGKDAGVTKRPPTRPFPVEKGVDYKQVGDMYQCCKCDKMHKTSNGVRFHVAKVHMKIPKYFCPYCSKKIVTESSFNKHKLEEHNIDDRFKCNACEGKFNAKVQFDRHLASFHMLGVKQKCDDCDFECFNIMSLNKHKVCHKTVRDLQCRYCTKSFKRPSTRSCHEKIHTGDKKKICNVCGQKFVQKASLNWHMTKHHPEEQFSAPIKNTKQLFKK